MALTNTLRVKKGKNAYNQAGFMEKLTFKLKDGQDFKR